MKRAALAGLLVVGAAALSSCQVDNSTHPPVDDLDAGWACELVEEGTVAFHGTVTNHSSKSSFYMVTVEVTIDGVEVGSHVATVDEVRPGVTADLDATVRRVPVGQPRCRVPEVERFKA